MSDKIEVWMGKNAFDTFISNAKNVIDNPVKTAFTSVAVDMDDYEKLIVIGRVNIVTRSPWEVTIPGLDEEARAKLLFDIGYNRAIENLDDKMSDVIYSNRVHKQINDLCLIDDELLFNLRTKHYPYPNVREGDTIHVKLYPDDIKRFDLSTGYTEDRVILEVLKISDPRKDNDVVTTGFICKLLL